jgi:hypothetical protein
MKIATDYHDKSFHLNISFPNENLGEYDHSDTLEKMKMIKDSTIIVQFISNENT